MTDATAEATYTVFSVFTPTTQARVNFVPRQAVNDQMVDALLTPGKQLIVYGESGSGKSTLLLKKLEETYPGHITTRCSASITFDQILLDAFDQLDHFYVEGAASATSRSIAPSIVADFSRIRASLDASRSHSQELTEKRLVPPQLTVQRLGQFLGAQELCWVIEDFHKTPPNEKTALAQSLKVFSDLAVDFPSLKIIALGATDTAREVVDYDSEMAHRVSELLVPLMNTDELYEILRNGERLLNVRFSGVDAEIVRYSVGLPSVCHQLALNTCLEGSVMATEPQTAVFGSDDLVRALQRYARESSDSLKASFSRALIRHKVRKYDNCRLILAALAAGPLDGMLHAELLTAIHKGLPDYPASNLTSYLRQLVGDARGNILRRGTDGRFRFVDPIHHTFAKATLVAPEQAPIKTELETIVYKSFVTILQTKLDGVDWGPLTIIPQSYEFGLPFSDPEER